MTKDEILAAILADNNLKSLVHQGNYQGTADSLNQTNLVTVPTLLGIGDVLNILGPSTANSVLDTLYANTQFKYIMPMLEQARLRLDYPLVIQTLNSLVPAILTQAQVDSIIALSKVPNSITEFDIRCAVFADDGTLKV